MTARSRRWVLLPLLLAGAVALPSADLRAGEPQPKGGADASPAAEFSQEAELAKLRKLLEGREGEPAEEVFESIEVLEGVPAGRLLAIMELGYSRSLGVTCTHCHDPKNYAANGKPAKRTARRMARLVERLNGELLPEAVTTEGSEPTVNCTTCHRGEKRPALRLAPRREDPLPAGG